jgi:hypothetical protein
MSQSAGGQDRHTGKEFLMFIRPHSTPWIQVPGAAALSPESRALLERQHIVTTGQLVGHLRGLRQRDEHVPDDLAEFYETLTHWLREAEEPVEEPHQGPEGERPGLGLKRSPHEAEDRQQLHERPLRRPMDGEEKP